MLERLLQWDRQTLIYLNNLGIEKYDPFWVGVTNITTWIPLFILFFVLLYAKYPKKQAIMMSLTTVFALGFILLCMQLTKESVARLRPNNDIDINALIRILKYPNSYSFFSGHAATSFGITTMIILFLKRRIKWIWIFLLWPFLFAFSRIYVGVHYPLDIIVGTLVGFILALLFYWLYNKFIAPKIMSAHRE